MATDNSGEPPAKASFALTDALLIGFVTAIAYYCSYRFEKAFLAAHYISADFVEVSLGTVLFAVAATLALFVAAFWAIAMLRPFASSKLVLLLWVSRWFIPFFLLFVFLLVKTGWSTGTWVFLALSLFFAWLTYVVPISRGKGTYWEKLLSSEKAEQKIQLQMFGPFLQFFGYRYWNWLLFLILVLPNIMGWWGDVTARSQRTFPTFNYQGRA
jgi:hypothetical protein